jgi:hypothetical protein
VAENVAERRERDGPDGGGQRIHYGEAQSGHRCQRDHERADRAQSVENAEAEDEKRRPRLDPSQRPREIPMLLNARDIALGHLVPADECSMVVIRAAFRGASSSH